MLQSAGCVGCTLTLPSRCSRAQDPAPGSSVSKPSQRCWQPPVYLEKRPACRPLCSAPAAVTEAISTAADAELPSAAEQATMDEAAAELVAKLDAACAQMEPDDVDISVFSNSSGHAGEDEPAAASAGRATKASGRRRKPLAKEIPADALPKVWGDTVYLCMYTAWSVPKQPTVPIPLICPGEGLGAAPRLSHQVL